MHGHADRAALVGERARDRLADPPRRVGRELVAAPVVELLGGAHEADRPLLDQVEERQALVAVVLGDRDDEPQVGLDHVLLGAVVAALDALGELDLLGRRQQLDAADLAQEERERVDRRVAIVDLERQLGAARRRRARRARPRARSGSRRSAPASRSSSSSAAATCSCVTKPAATPRSIRTRASSRTSTEVWVLTTCSCSLSSGALPSTQARAVGASVDRSSLRLADLAPRMRPERMILPLVRRAFSSGRRNASATLPMRLVGSSLTALANSCLASASSLDPEQQEAEVEDRADRLRVLLDQRRRALRPRSPGCPCRSRARSRRPARRAIVGSAATACSAAARASVRRPTCCSATA